MEIFSVRHGPNKAGAILVCPVMCIHIEADELTIIFLSQFLNAESSVKESDKPWYWERLFTEVIPKKHDT